MGVILIGIDDTDMPDTPGTGKLARQVCAEIERLGGRHRGTTGHQLLLDPRVPFTGHNRSICIGMDWEGPVKDLDFVLDIVGESAAEGSDPGVCMAVQESVGEAVMAWGERALHEVLTMNEARAVANAGELALVELGGTGQGIIGALASVGLRAGGQTGRFVDMPGLRGLGEWTSREALEAMGIRVEYTTAGRQTDRGVAHKTLGWVRPRLSGGNAVLAVEWSEHDDAWVPVDRKKVHFPASALEQGGY